MYHLLCTSSLFSLKQFTLLNNAAATSWNATSLRLSAFGASNRVEDLRTGNHETGGTSRGHGPGVLHENAPANFVVVSAFAPSTFHCLLLGTNCICSHENLLECVSGSSSAVALASSSQELYLARRTARLSVAERYQPRHFCTARLMRALPAYAREPRSTSSLKRLDMGIVFQIRPSEKELIPWARSPANTR